MGEALQPNREKAEVLRPSRLILSTCPLETLGIDTWTSRTLSGLLTAGLFASAWVSSGSLGASGVMLSPSSVAVSIPSGRGSGTQASVAARHHEATTGRPAGLSAPSTRLHRNSTAKIIPLQLQTWESLNIWPEYLWPQKWLYLNHMSPLCSLLQWQCKVSHSYRTMTYWDIQWWTMSTIQETLEKQSLYRNLFLVVK